MIRSLMAFLIAPLIAPFLMFFWARDLNPTGHWLAFTLVVIAIVTYVGVGLFGIPAYLLLRARKWTRFWLAPVLGFAFGAVIWLAFGVVFGLLLGHSLAAAVSFTADAKYLAGVFWPGGVAGVAVGATFWLIARPDRSLEAWD